VKHHQMLEFFRAITFSVRDCFGRLSNIVAAAQNAPLVHKHARYYPSQVHL